MRIALRSKSTFGPSEFLILFAFITGKNSLEPLLEGLLAEIHLDLRSRGFGQNRIGNLRITHISVRCRTLIHWAKVTNESMKIHRNPLFKKNGRKTLKQFIGNLSAVAWNRSKAQAKHFRKLHWKHAEGVFLKHLFMSNLYFEKYHFTGNSIGDQPSTFATLVPDGFRIPSLIPSLAFVLSSHLWLGITSQDPRDSKRAGDSKPTCRTQGVGTTFCAHTKAGKWPQARGTHPPPPLQNSNTVLASKFKCPAPKYKYVAPKLKHTAPNFKYMIFLYQSKVPLSENNFYSVALRTRTLKIRNRSMHRNTSNRKTEHHSIPSGGYSRGPKIGTYSDREF